MSHLNFDEVRSEALFVSALQPSDEPTAEHVRTEIMIMVRRFGVRGCAARMAQEYGDSPDSAIARMRWARRTVAATFPARPDRAPARVLVGAGHSDRASVAGAA